MSEPPAPVRVELGERAYDVFVERAARRRVGSLLRGRGRVAIVTQRATDVHAEPVRAALDEVGVGRADHRIDDGEGAKSLATVELLARGFARAGLLRGDAVVAVGGGVVGDVAGFTAAVYHRGVDVVQVPTTLLAMVDAAIGGKTAVNLPEGKNLVGAFHQPLAVLADPATLATLPDAEYRSGLGEVAKYALLGDESLALLVEARSPELLARDPDALATVVRACAELKAAVVAADERETSGDRARLNYGHTLAHALETVGTYDLRHGEAVAIGLVFAAELAGALERIDGPRVTAQRRLVASLGLPTEVPPGTSADQLVAVMRRDKKARGGLTFVLDGPRGVELVADPPARAVAAALAAVGVEA